MAVIKSMTRKTGSYRQLIEYFLKEQREGASKTDSFIIKHNVRGNNIDQWVKAFESNEAKRLIKRSNNVKIYHEVYSLNKIDKGQVTPAILRDLAEKYIELRNPNAMCICVPHLSVQNAHLHFMLSGVETETGRSLRISKEDFALFKKELQEYQLRKYPQLSHSVVRHGKKQKDKIKSIKDKEYQLTKRTQTPSERERLKQAIEQSYSLSLSRADFMHRLREQGLQTYSRGGTERGVVSGERKFTFSHLGFDQKHLKEIDIRDEALKGIQVFRDEKEKDKEIENEVSVEREIEYKSDTDYKEGKEAEEDKDVEVEQDVNMESDFDMDI